MTITITAFERSPDGGKGLARDTRVRWALEEVGQPYQVRLVSFRAMKEPAHLALHPFGQIPTYEEGDLALFETGAIVFHIAERHAGLLPDDANARARAITWMFAALSTVEPPILELGTARLLEGDKPWYAERLPLVEDRVGNRLGQLSVRLGDADWLDGAFSAGDLMMVSVLLRLKPSGILDEYPNLAAYVARGEARPAYKRAFDAQLAVIHRQAIDRLAFHWIAIGESPLHCGALSEVKAAGFREIRASHPGGEGARWLARRQARQPRVTGRGCGPPAGPRCFLSHFRPSWRLRTCRHEPTISTARAETTGCDVRLAPRGRRLHWAGGLGPDRFRADRLEADGFGSGRPWPDRFEPDRPRFGPERRGPSQDSGQSDAGPGGSGPIDAGQPSDASGDDASEPVCVTSAAKGSCGPYLYPAITGSDGSNTTVGQDVWNPISGWSQTLYATNPGTGT